ncbi:MAG: tetratricopeptide repeat protein [Phycisphaerae bacterium]|jgi:tetratricopeptide (TPR) repeat protein|nr:tetratricopeptide repeat protein [Phycisphaerae bacterium]
MAKRKKKLNKKLVAALSAVAVLLLLVVGLGLYKFRNDLFPKNPVPHAKAGLDALEKGQYELAVKELSIAAGAANTKDDEAKKIKAEYYYDLGRTYLEWIKKDKGLSQSQKSDFLKRCLGSMQQATTLDRTYLAPHETLYDIHWQFAYGQMRMGRTGVDWTQFIAAASALIGIDSDNPVPYYRRGVAHGSIGEHTGDTRAWRKGLADFRKAIALDTDNVDYWAAWLTLLKWAQPKDAKINVDAGFLEAFKAKPNSAGLRIMYANHLRRRDRSDEAEEQLRAAIKCEPTSPRGHISMAGFLLDSEQYDAALKELVAAVAIDSTLAAIYLQRSKIHRATKKLDEAVKALQDGVKALEPTHSAAAASQPASKRTKSLTERMNRLNFALANAALDCRRTLGDKKQQVEMVKIARKSFEKLDNLPAKSPHLAKLSGRLAVIRGDRTAAIKSLERAYKAFGLADLQTPALLITLYDSVGMPGKAEKLLISLQNAPRLQDSVDVVLALVRLKIRYQDYEAADILVNKALRIDPQHKSARQLKSELQLLTGREVSGARAGALSTAGVRAMVARADLKWVDGQRKEALAMLVDLRKALPKDLLLAERAINMHLMLGDKDSAKAILKEMLVAYPENDNLKFQTALIDKTSEQRLEMQLARIDEKVTDPFVRAWAKARIASRAGNKQMHSKFFAEAVALKPDAPSITAVQFRTAVHTKDWDTAFAVIQRVEKISELRGKSMRAELFVRQGKHAQAITVLAPLRKNNPDSKFVLRMLGECYLATKQIEQAGDVFGVLESNDPGDVTALIGLAIVAQRQGRLKDNEGYVMRAYRKPTGRKHPYINRRHLEIRESQVTGDEIGKIIERREKLHKLGPKDPNYLNNLARLATLCEYRTRDLTRAGELYREAYEKTAHSLQWGRTLAFFYARNGEPAKGEAILKAGISESKSAPAKVSWLVMHGDFLTMFNPDQALRAYNQASLVDPQNPLPFRAKAALYARAGKWPKAIEHMIAYVARRGEDMRGRKTLIQYRINGRQYEKAEKALETILSRNPTDAQALLLKAVLFTLRGSPAKAVTVATRAVDKHPEFSAAFAVRARAYLVMGELEQAKDDLEAARALSRTPQISMELVNVYTNLGRDEDALTVLKSIVAEYKTYEAAVYRLISIHMKNADWPNAESIIAEAQKRFPKQPRYLMIESEMWQRRGQSAKTVVALDKAYELGKESMPLVRVYLLGLLKAKAYDKALTVVNIYKDKPLWSAWVNAVLGRIMVVKKQDAKANEVFIKSVEDARADELAFVVSQMREAYGSKVAIETVVTQAKKKPTDWYIRVLLARLCSTAITDREEKLTAAERSRYAKLAIDNYVLAVAKAKKPADIAALSNRLGKAYYDNGQPREAEKAYLKCLEITPGNHAALNNLAYLYVDDLNEPEKALPYVRKVIRLRPQDPNVLDTYGWVMGKRKKYAEAKKYLQRSIERDPELAACRYHLGWVLEQTGDKRRAMNQYRLGMELIRTQTHAPLYKQFQGALKRLGT